MAGGQATQDLGISIIEVLSSADEWTLQKGAMSDLIGKWSSSFLPCTVQPRHYVPPLQEAVSQDRKSGYYAGGSRFAVRSPRGDHVLDDAIS